MAEQRSGNEVCALKQAGIDCEFRQQGGAETVVDHLNQCWKARRFEALGETPVRKTADRKRVVTQAVTFSNNKSSRHKRSGLTRASLASRCSRGNPTTNGSSNRMTVSTAPQS